MNKNVNPCASGESGTVPKAELRPSLTSLPESTLVRSRLESSLIVLAYCACVLIWGTTWFAIRLCVLPGAFEPYTAAAIRCIVAVSCLAMLWLTGFVKTGPLQKSELAWTIVAGSLSAIGFAFVYNAERWVSGGLAAILTATSPLVTAIFLTVTGTERVALRSVIGALIALSGIVLIFNDRLFVSQTQAIGVVLLASSVVVASFSSVLLKKHASNQSPFVSVSVFMAIGAIAFSSASTLWEHGLLLVELPVIPLLAAGYLGIVGSVIAFSCYLYLMKRIRLMTLNTLVFFPPLIALGVDACWEREVVLTAATYGGMGLTLLGLCVEFLLRFRRQGRPRATH